MERYIKFIFGEEILQQVKDLKENVDLTLPVCKREDQDFRIESKEIKISKQSEKQMQVKIDKLDVTILRPVDKETMIFIKSLMSVPHHICVEINSLSITTSETLPSEKKRMPFAKVVNTEPLQHISCPNGHSYPSEDEWGIVFGCPFYQTFPSCKALPVVILEGEVQVSLREKKAQSYRTFLLPLYLVFYESQNSSKPVDSVFLTGAKIEVDNPHQYSIIKSGDKFSLSFSSIPTMQQWSQATLCTINDAAASLERWRRDNS